MDGLNDFLNLANPVEIVCRAGWGGLLMLGCCGFIAIGATIAVVAPSGGRIGILMVLVLAAVAMLLLQGHQAVAGTLASLQHALNQVLPALRRLPFL